MSEKIQETVFEAVNTLIDAKLRNINFDSTILCKVIDITDATVGRYIVSNGNASFTAYSIDKNYQKDDQVYVMIPGNDYSQQKIILGKEATYDNSNGSIEGWINPLATMATLRTLNYNYINPVSIEINTSGQTPGDKTYTPIIDTTNQYIRLNQYLGLVYGDSLTLEMCQLDSSKNYYILEDNVPTLIDSNLICNRTPGEGQEGYYLLSGWSNDGLPMYAHKDTSGHIDLVSDKFLIDDQFNIPLLKFNRIGFSVDVQTLFNNLNLNTGEYGLTCELKFTDDTSAEVILSSKTDFLGNPYDLDFLTQQEMVADLTPYQHKTLADIVIKAYQNNAFKNEQGIYQQNPYPIADHQEISLGIQIANPIIYFGVALTDVKTENLYLSAASDTYPVTTDNYTVDLYLTWVKLINDKLTVISSSNAILYENDLENNFEIKWYRKISNIWTQIELTKTIEGVTQEKQQWERFQIQQDVREETQQGQQVIPQQAIFKVQIFDNNSELYAVSDELVLTYDALAAARAEAASAAASAASAAVGEVRQIAEDAQTTAGAASTLAYAASSLAYDANQNSTIALSYANSATTIAQGAQDSVNAWTTTIDTLSNSLTYLSSTVTILRQDLSTSINNLGATLRNEFNGSITNLESNLNTSINNLGTTLRQEFNTSITLLSATLSASISQLGTSLSTSIINLGASITNLNTDVSDLQTKGGPTTRAEIFCGSSINMFQQDKYNGQFYQYGINQELKDDSLSQQTFYLYPYLYYKTNNTIDEEFKPASKETTLYIKWIIPTENTMLKTNYSNQSLITGPTVTYNNIDNIPISYSNDGFDSDFIINFVQTELLADTTYYIVDQSYNDSSHRELLVLYNSILSCLEFYIYVGWNATITDFRLPYQIKNHLIQGANNIVNVKVVEDDDQTYVGSRTLYFGLASQDGSPYHIEYEFLDGKNGIEFKYNNNYPLAQQISNVNTNYLEIQLKIKDQDGNNISLPQNWNSNSLFLADYYDHTISNTNIFALNIDDNIIKIKKDENYPGQMNINKRLLVLSIKDLIINNYKLNLDIPIPFINQTTSQYLLGPKQISYASNGSLMSNTEFSPYNLILLNNNITPLYSICWASSFGEDWIAPKYGPSLVDAILVPGPTYIKQSNVYYAVEVTNNNQLLYLQPIIITQDRYPSERLNNWDGAFKIDNGNSTIYAASIAAGKKDINNTFTGVIMGDWSKDGNSSLKQTGLYGFAKGENTFYLREDGNAYLKGNIEADSGYFHGSIEAEDGNIGGWIINNNLLKDETGTTILRTNPSSSQHYITTDSLGIDTQITKQNYQLLTQDIFSSFTVKMVRVYNSEYYEDGLIITDLSATDIASSEKIHDYARIIHYDTGSGYYISVPLLYYFDDETDSYIQLENGRLNLLKYETDKASFYISSTVTDIKVVDINDVVNNRYRVKIPLYLLYLYPKSLKAAFGYLAGSDGTKETNNVGITTSTTYTSLLLEAQGYNSNIRLSAKNNIYIDAGYNFNTGEATGSQIVLTDNTIKLQLGTLPWTINATRLTHLADLVDHYDNIKNNRTW